MSSCYIIISYHIISSFLLCLLRISSPLYTIQLYFNWTLFNFILFDWIRFIILFSIVSRINEWFVSIRLSVSLSVWLSVSLCCMNKFLFCFLCFSFSYRFSFSSHLWFPFSSFYLMNIFLAHTCSHAHSRTLTYKWLHVSSYDFYVLLRKEVCEESYSSDCIISYLI